LPELFDASLRAIAYSADVLAPILRQSQFPYLCAKDDRRSHRAL